MKQSDYEKLGESGKAATIIRIVILVLLIGFIGAVMIISSPKNDNLSDIWDTRTTLGDVNAKHHYIMSTDIMCPYCDYFSRALMTRQEDFEKWLKDNDVVYEMRITDFLNEYGEAGAKSEQAAEATLCATEEDKFWDYYHAAMIALYNDYHSKGIGNAKGAPMITGMTADYWLEIGKSVGLGDSFEDCYRNHKQLDHVRENTAKVAKIMQKSNVGGMPYFQFEELETSGFETSWGWSQIKSYYLDAGLKK